MKPFFEIYCLYFGGGSKYNHHSGDLIFVFGFDFGLNILASDCFDASTIYASPSLPLIKWFSLLNNRLALYSFITKSRNDNPLFQMASNNAKHFTFHYLNLVNSLCQCISNHHRPMFMLAHKFLEFPENIPGSKFLKLPLLFS